MTRAKFVSCALWISVGILLPHDSIRESGAFASGFSLLPIFETHDGDFIRLSLVNTSDAPSNVTITWTSADGKTDLQANLSLYSGAQCVALVREILAMPADPLQGWIRIDASEPGLVSTMTTGHPGIEDATVSASRIFTQITLPHIEVNTGFMELAYADTLINLVNPGSALASASCELINLDGVPNGKIKVFIPPRVSRILRISDSFGAVLPANGAGGKTFRGYLKVASDIGLAGWLQIDTPLSRRLFRGVGAEEILPARLALVSHFAFGSPSLYRSALNFINAGDSTLVLDLEARDNLGKKLATARRMLKPGQGFREDVLSLFPMVIPAVYPPLMLTGYIRIRAEDGSMFQWIGDIDITREGNSAAMLYPIEAPSWTSFLMPLAASNSDYFTGFAIANPNELLTVQTDITIDLFDVDGYPVGSSRKISLSPAARYVGLIEEKLSSGYFRIRANFPIALLGSIGTWNGSILAPLQSIPCKGQAPRYPNRSLKPKQRIPLFDETIPVADLDESDEYPACSW